MIDGKMNPGGLVFVMSWAICIWEVDEKYGSGKSMAPYYGSGILARSPTPVANKYFIG